MSYSYDGEVEAAVRRFQARHGLRVSGRVDQPTIAALNVSAEARLAQLKLNRGRLLELMGQRVEDRYVLVNVPAFQLEAVERHEVALRHRVIVGRTERQTPTLKATIRALNFFPYWRVPESVATLDLIPRLRKEPEYLVNEKIRVFNGYNGPELDPMQVDWNTADGAKLKFKQDPGQQNALGLVRIDMANEHGVYMHDTPLKKLFEQRGRAFSAGCVRVQGVFELVEWIARGEAGWEPRPRGRGDRLRAGARPQPDAADPGLFHLHHSLGRAQRARRVPPRPLRPRRRPRPCRRSRSRRPAAAVGWSGAVGVRWQAHRAGPAAVRSRDAARDQRTRRAAGADRATTSQVNLHPHAMRSGTFRSGKRKLATASAEPDPLILSQVGLGVAAR